MNIDDIAAEALRLPPKERALLAGSLWESLDDPFISDPPSDKNAALSLSIERDQEIESGQVKPISHDELMARLRR